MHDFPSLICISPFPNSFQHECWTEATDMPGNVFSTKDADTPPSQAVKFLSATTGEVIGLRE